MSFHCFVDNSTEPTEYGSFEVFHFNGEGRSMPVMVDGDGAVAEAGWYWWACHPGCLPDGDPHGPFASEEEAIKDALDE